MAVGRVGFLGKAAVLMGDGELPLLTPEAQGQAQVGEQLQKLELLAAVGGFPQRMVPELLFLE